MERSTLFSACLGCLLFWGGSAGAAPILYGVNAGDKGLSRIDRQTGEVDFIGRLSPLPGSPGSFLLPVALATRPGTGALYAWNNPLPSGGAGLVRVDTQTGRGTAVSPPGAPAPQFGALAFSPDGTLVALGQHVASVDPDTGSFELGTTRFLPSFAGADFSPQGVLHAVDIFSKLFIDYDPATETWARTLTLTFEDGTGFERPDILGSVVFTPEGDLLGSAFLAGTFEEIETLFRVEANGTISQGGAPPGEAGSGLDAVSGLTYLWDANGVLLDFAFDSELNLVFDPPPPEGEFLIQTETVVIEPSRNVLFQIDPASGRMSDLVDLDAETLPQGLAFVPEPSPLWLGGAGILLGWQRRRAWRARKVRETA